MPELQDAWEAMPEVQNREERQNGIPDPADIDGVIAAMLRDWTVQRPELTILLALKRIENKLNAPD